MQLYTQLLCHAICSSGFQKVPGLTGLLTASNQIAFLLLHDSILYLMQDMVVTPSQRTKEQLAV